MIFGEYYKNQKKDGYRYLGSVFPIIIYIIVGLIIASIIYQKIDTYLEQRAKIRERLISVSNLCRNVAQTEKLVFVSSNTILSTENETTVVYTYRTDKQFAEIIPELGKYSKEPNWRATNTQMLDFTDGYQSVSIQSNDNFLRNYQIYCSERGSSISFGIYDF